MVHWWFSKIAGYPKIAKGGIIWISFHKETDLWTPPVALHQQAWLACRKGLARHQNRRDTLVFSTVGHHDLFLKLILEGISSIYWIYCVWPFSRWYLWLYKDACTWGTYVWNMNMCVLYIQLPACAISYINTYSTCIPTSYVGNALSIGTTRWFCLLPKRGSHVGQ